MHLKWYTKDHNSTVVNPLSCNFKRLKNMTLPVEIHIEIQYTMNGYEQYYYKSKILNPHSLTHFWWAITVSPHVECILENYMHKIILAKPFDYFDHVSSNIK